MKPTFFKRLLLVSGLVPLMLGAAVTAPQTKPEKPCERGYSFWGMDNFFNHPFPRIASAYSASTMKESDKAYLISIDLPGMDKKDIRVETVGNRITVSGERKEESESKTGTKRSLSQFQQSYLLPDDADLDKISATSANGVLKITVPKTGTKVSKKIEIK